MFPPNRWRDRLIEMGINPPCPGIPETANLKDALATLRARDNELNCIYSFTQLMDREEYSIDEFLSRVVDILPPWWQYPEVAKRKQTSAKLADSRHQLEVERTSLREANAALRLVLQRIEEEKKEAQREILDNMDRILMPIIRELETSVAPDQKKYVALLAENLGHITSPFIRSLARESQSLTPTEVQICKLIRDGMGSKQIAELRDVSLATIHRHREHIRHKLGITHRKVNLTSFLQSIL